MSKDLIEQNRIRQRMELRFEKRLLREFNAIGRSAAEVYESEARLRILLDGIEQRLLAIFQPHYRSVLEEFSRRQAQLLNLAKEETQFERMFRLFMRDVGAENVKDVTDTTIKRIQQAILKAFALELTLEEISERIEDSVGGSIGRYRSRLIARTETHAASSYANHTIAKDADIPEMKKRWVSANDARTRPHHVEMNGVEVGLDDDFEVPYNGIPYRMAYPGDPRGGPGNVINCFTGDTLVSYGNCKNVIRSLYTGKLITIKTASGYQLTGTPNHPIMTETGFVPLGEIKEGDNLVCCVLEKDFADGANVKHVPSSFKQVYDAALELGITVRESGIAVNLYGRIPDGDVDVVRASGLLLNNVETHASQNVRELVFQKSNLGPVSFFCNRLLNSWVNKKVFGKASNFFVCVSNLIRSLFVGHLRPFQQLRFGLSSNSDAMFFEKSTNDITRHRQPLSDSVFAHSRGIQRDCLRSQGIEGASFTGDAKSSNSFGHQSRRTIESRCKLSVSLSSSVHLDKCVLVDENFSHNSPVYTLDTKEGIYNAGGILSKNCRCVVAYVIPEDFTP